MGQQVDRNSNSKQVEPADSQTDRDVHRPATCPAITTYDSRLVRRRPSLFPDELLAGRDFRKMVLRDNFPIPPDEFREGYCSGRDISYWLHGLVCFLKTMKTVEDHGLQVKSVLDFGSASGRVARHFRNQLDDVTVWAADINPDHIAWLRTHIPRNPKSVLVGELPGLPIADNSLDLVCAYSVFTHIDQQETGWLLELHRVLRPGGMAYLTVHNDDTWAAMRKIDPSNRLIKSMLMTPEFSIEQLQNPIPQGKTVFHFADTGPYRSQVFHSDDYLRQSWGRFFRILEIQPLGHYNQSVVLLTKIAER